MCLCMPFFAKGLIEENISTPVKFRQIYFSNLNETLLLLYEFLSLGRAL